MATVNHSHRQDLLSLPFDQYSRQFVVANVINTALRKKGASLKLLDMGGHKGKTQDFLPQDKVTIIDVFEESYADYVKGDATNMTFADDEFDIATSFDVFEHIPRESRQAFINEGLRVSKIGMFIAMPIDSDEGAVSNAEQLLNDLHKDLYDNDHQWLKEHIDYKIPVHDEILKLVKKAGAQSVSLASNQITDWQLIQTMIFAAARNPHMTVKVDELNKWYNANVDQLELGVEPGYRRIYFVTKDSVALDAVKKAMHQLATTENRGEHRYLKVHESTLAQTLKAVTFMAKKCMELVKSNDLHYRKRTAAEHQLIDLKKENNMLRAELEGIRRSLSWRVTQPLRSVSKRLKP